MGTMGYYRIWRGQRMARHWRFLRKIGAASGAALIERFANEAQRDQAAAKMRIVRERARRAERKRERWLRKEIEG